MATDSGRIHAAISGIVAVEYNGPEKEIAIELLQDLATAVKASENRELRDDQFVSVADLRRLISQGDL